ncbi:MAG: ABC transporter permease subunit [Deltaproteobacteria bacterium]|nr:ABC transporter permease subunit [Deltaproteobacteria bacterium]
MDQLAAISERKKAILSSLALLAILLAVWQLTTKPPIQGKAEELPGPVAVAARAWEMISDPFYDRGPNDKGIGIQLGYSIGRLLVGYTAAAFVAICLGVALGLSPTFYRALNPYIQILKPISPLAWMPLFLYTIKDSSRSAMMVIFMSSLWPILANTAFGVAGIKRDYLNVSALLQLSWFKRLWKVILPAAAPAIVAGLRISIGSAWVAIVAAEMLIGGTGIGYFVWNEWNNLQLTSVIFAILLTGFVGVVLDMGFGSLAKVLAYKE